MSMLIPLTLLGFIPFTVALYFLLPARRAAIAAFIISWMFLPVAGMDLGMLPDYTKVTAPSVAVLLCMMLFDRRRLFSFAPTWVDLPMFVWCGCPMLSSLSNGLGWYDGVAGVVNYTLIWGLPYVIGRVCITDFSAMRDLAIGVFIGGLVYIPLCLYEIRMSPQLHNMLYGYHPAAFVHTLRYGGYRPMGFMHGGLALAIWMASALLTGGILWHSGKVRRFVQIPMVVLLIALFVTLVLCKSSGALLLLILATGMYLCIRYTQTWVVLTVALLTVPVYLTARVGMDWDGHELITFAEQMFDEDRAASLETRFYNEELLVDKAMERALFGWGGWGRNRIVNDQGEDISITDSLWIVVFSQRGMLGLVSVYAVMLLPVCVMILRASPRWLATPQGAPALAMGLLMWMYMMDKLLNAQPNPVFMLVAGGLVTVPWRVLAAPSVRRVVGGGRPVVQWSSGPVVQ